ncbi:hypothetical protein SMACR_12775 [Sordaria macrospora]|uniref:WGS project CABT00000000 data, contig 2.4 n=2 Tax=Sordaria macrospora TaxID=5147 RepID=F7VRF0_SORMK|nr:uncharacterized protein SMAC_12775 [Sordaria macrospora k-hell]KAA8635245.1 hypothetical protein SMACR_12775 [Sordaria macrospora]KAH7634760.1 hypothetical protein B0T09DRAFT_316637 [Sordaria sp. MPI-SDFR-AT-0083]WPJ58463.1 hypothetical protein SMAC4_12775 [Sordaria macrospora]CCC08085.1 unnamed protein product [Sordaria macrospora k-hell]
MCLIFTCGEHTFRKEVEGYEGLVCRCYNCGNYSGSVIKSHPWFTFCFVPVIPLSIKGYEDIACRICNFQQPLEHRQDVQAMRRGADGTRGVPLQPQPSGVPPQGVPPQGWGQKAPEPNQPMQYR